MLAQPRYFLPAAALLLLSHVALRAWMIFPSWFFLDDFALLRDGDRSSPGLTYLLEPYNGHLMPGGRMIAWLVAQSGLVNWPMAASITLALQAAATAALIWMLIVLFGRRWAIFVPLSLFITTSLAVPSFIWWAAALDLVPIQATSCLAVGAWVAYLRSGSWRWLAITTISVVAGLFFWVKALLILPVLAFLAIAWFGRGTGWRRLWNTARDYWQSIVVLGGVSAIYLTFYVTRASQEVDTQGSTSLGALAETMLGTAFATGVVGGPWTWSAISPPTAYAAPPAWATSLSWAVIAVSLLLIWLRRRGSLKAWALLAGYLVMLLLLLYGSRAQSFGQSIGLEYRYLADASFIVALALGLAMMRLEGAPGSSTTRDPPLLARAVPLPIAATVVIAVAVGGVTSSITYAGYWHRDNAAEHYLKTAQDDLKRYGRVDLANHVVPERVMSQLAAPLNQTAFLVPLVSDRARFPEASSNLATLGVDGSLRQATIGPGSRSEAPPFKRCGWRVNDEGRTIPLTNTAFDWTWWLRIGYLYSGDSAVSISAGGDTVETHLLPGANNLFVRVDGTFDRVRIDGLKQNTTMCVDAVEVGPVEPGGPL